jgi:hypothetical protein
VTDDPTSAPEPAKLAGPPDPLTPWPTAPSFDAAILAQFRVESRYGHAFGFAHIGTCGFMAIGAARRLDLLCSTSIAHAAICDGTGPYPRVNDPDPGLRRHPAAGPEDNDHA